MGKREVEGRETVAAELAGVAYGAQIAIEAAARRAVGAIHEGHLEVALQGWSEVVRAASAEVDSVAVVDDASAEVKRIGGEIDALRKAAKEHTDAAKTHKDKATALRKGAASVLAAAVAAGASRGQCETGGFHRTAIEREFRRQQIATTAKERGVKVGAGKAARQAVNTVVNGTAAEFDAAMAHLSEGHAWPELANAMAEDDAATLDRHIKAVESALETVRTVAEHLDALGAACGALETVTATLLADATAITDAEREVLTQSAARLTRVAAALVKRGETANVATPAEVAAA